MPDYALSSYEFDLLWNELCLGRMPGSLVVPRTGRTPGERAVLAKEIYRELTDRGLVDHDRRVDVGLSGLLRLLSGYRVAVDLVGDIGYPVRAVAATDGRAGVLAMLAGGELWLTGISPAGLATAIVGLLPAARPPGRNAGGRFGFSASGGRAVASAMTWFDTESGRYLVVDEQSRLCLVSTGRAGIERRIAGCLLPAGDTSRHRDQARRPVDSPFAEG